jgi:hypothetical protein
VGTSCDFGVPYVNFGILQIFNVRYPAQIDPGPPSDFTVSDAGSENGKCGSVTNKSNLTCQIPVHAIPLTRKIRQIRKMGMTFAGTVHYVRQRDLN